MTTTMLEVELPSTTTKDEAKLLLAVKMFEVGKITLGQAAKIAGYSKQAFIEVLKHQKVPIFNYSGDELREELGCIAYFYKT